MAVPALSSVVINTTDVAPLVAFWSALLEVGVAREIPGGYFTWLEASAAGTPSLAFQKVPDPTPGRRRLHLDFSVEDVAATRARVEQLGGRHVEDHEIMGFAWMVLADPDGNEFCVAAAG